MQKKAMDESPDMMLDENANKRSRSALFLFGMILVTLWIQAVLRLWIAGELLLQPTIENQFGAIVHWRGFDQFTGWITLAILASVEGSALNAPRKEITSRLVQVFLGVGVIALSVSLLWGETTGRAILDIAVAGLLAVAALIICWRQMREIARSIAGNHADEQSGNRGLNLEQLWRVITIQWVFLWIAAELTLRIHFRVEGVEAEQKARDFLFILPVAGVTTNMMMAVGIKWWSALRGTNASPRIRAWLVAIVLVNIGAACVAAGIRWGHAFSVSGGILMAVGIGLYLLGFPHAAWKHVSTDSASRSVATGSGALVPLAFLFLFLGIAMMTSESFFPNDVPALYSFAWRHLLASAQIIWLLGMAGLAVKRFAPGRLLAGTKGVSLAGILMLLLGILAVATTFLVAIHDRNTLRGLFVGEGLEAAGLVLLAMLFIRITLGMKK